MAMKLEDRNHVLALALSVCVIVPTFLYARWMWKEESGYADLKQLCLALHQYHDQWDSFPPLQWENNVGTTLSFRVLLMAHFETDEAKAVAELAHTVNSAAELEESEAFQNWSKTLEGRRFLHSSIEFTPVIGDWPSWGKSSIEASKVQWNERSTPMIVLTEVTEKPEWCLPGTVAGVTADEIRISKRGRDGTVRYHACDCSIHSAKARASIDRN